MAARLILHVGHGKTGTSTVQNTMRVNSDLLRERCSLNYPGFASNHWLFGRAFLSPGEYGPIDQASARDGRSPEALDRAAAAAVEGLRADAGRYATHVISSELFFHLGRPALERFKARLDEIGFETSILIYTRNPVDFISSLMNQWVKSGSKTLAGVDAVDINIKTRIGVFASLFRRDRLQVRVYGREHFVNGDLIDDFVAAVNGAPVDGLQRPRSVNASLSLPALRIADALNRIAEPKSRERGPDAYLQEIAGPTFRAPRRVVEASLAAQAESLRFLADEFGIRFPDPDLSAFPDEISRVVPDETVASLVTLLNAQSLKIAELKAKVRALSRKRQRSVGAVLRSATRKLV
ncbi:MAG TPA: hypothetical protein PKA74_11555, partial [Bauldia sp.]|nr:hypothetical protein [Bauldia sp.]